MCSKIRTLIYAGVLIFGSSTAEALPLYSFDVIFPNGGNVGAAGSTVGWGYSITNNSNNYLVPTAINADLFANGTPFALFDFPVIAPHGSAGETFVANSSGLYQLTWDQLAPIGFSNSGLFSISADFYSGDPAASGVFLFAANDAFAAYSATVAPAVAIPEPQTPALVLLGLAMLVWSIKRHRVCEEGPSLSAVV